MVLQRLILCLTEKSPGKQSELLIINQARNAITSVHYRLHGALCKRWMFGMADKNTSTVSAVNSGAKNWIAKPWLCPQSWRCALGRKPDFPAWKMDITVLFVCSQMLFCISRKSDCHMEAPVGKERWHFPWSNWTYSRSDTSDTSLPALVGAAEQQLQQGVWEPAAKGETSDKPGQTITGRSNICLLQADVKC